MRAASESHLYSKDESLEVSITWIFLRRKEAMQLVTQQRSPCIMRTAILIAVGWFVFFPTTASAAEIPSKTVPARTYSLGIVPQHKAADLAARWVPLLQYLSARTGLHVEFRTARDIPTFEQQLAQGEYDFAYMNPFQYVLFQQKSGYRALARQRAYGLRGIVVVRADSPYRTLRDLEGQALAFPAPSAFAASILTRAQLRAEGVRTTPSFVVSHDSVYYGVVNRLFAGGGGRRKPWTGSIPRCARNCACSGPRPNTRRTRSRRMRACPPA